MGYSPWGLKDTTEQLTHTHTHTHTHTRMGEAVYFFFFGRTVACRILVPRPWIKPVPTWWKCGILTTRPLGNSGEAVLRKKHMK